MAAAFPSWALRLSQFSQKSARVLSREHRRGVRARPPAHSRALKPERKPQSSSVVRTGQSKSVENASQALLQASKSGTNPLLTPVHLPEDPHGILRHNHPATSILENSSIVVQRQVEMMNILVGFEQANKYVIMDPQGNQIGFLAEKEHGVGNAIARQAFRTHRSFTTHVFDKHENEVLRFHRPFSWISSRIRVYDAVESRATGGSSIATLPERSLAATSSRSENQMRVIGEAQQQWAPLRRKYNLFVYRDMDSQEIESNVEPAPGGLPLSETKSVMQRDIGSMEQFAYLNEPFLSWDFSLRSADNQLIGSVNRNFAGFAREIFTDTGCYVLRLDSAGLAAEPQHMISRTGRDLTNVLPAMTLDQRAVMLATAVSIDFDYFSRHSHAGGFMPFPIFMGGGEAAGEAGAVGAAGTATEAGSAVGAATRTVGMSDGAVAGAGTMAGYEAMSRTRESQQQQDDASPWSTDADTYTPQSQQTQNPWSDNPPSAGASPHQDAGSDGGTPGGDGGGGGGFDWGEWFGE